MEKQVMNIKDLRDSKLLFNEKLPVFGYIIVLLIVILLGALIVWSIFAPKAQIVSVTGIVESENKSYIMPMYGGEITNLYVAEGQYIEAGTAILSLKSVEVEMQLLQVEKNIAIYENQLSQYKKLEQSIKDGINHFDPSADNDIQYYNEYCAYKSKIAQKEIDYTVYEMYGYTDEQIKQQIKINEAAIEEIYYSELQYVGEQITNCNMQINSYIAQREAYHYANNAYVICANTSGTVHLDNCFKGMVVSAGSTLGSISPRNDNYIIKAFISISDAPRISLNDRVDISIDGLSQTIYGTISGSVVQISSDVIISEDDNPYFEVLISPDQNYFINSDGHQVLLSAGMAAKAWIVYDEMTYFEWIIEKIGLKND